MTDVVRGLARAGLGLRGSIGNTGCKFGSVLGSGCSHRHTTPGPARRGFKYTTDVRRGTLGLDDARDPWIAARSPDLCGANRERPPHSRVPSTGSRPRGARPSTGSTHCVASRGTVSSVAVINSSIRASSTMRWPARPWLIEQTIEAIDSESIAPLGRPSRGSRPTPGQSAYCSNHPHRQELCVSATPKPAHSWAWTEPMTCNCSRSSSLNTTTHSHRTRHRPSLLAECRLMTQDTRPAPPPGPAATGLRRATPASARGAVRSSAGG